MSDYTTEKTPRFCIITDIPGTPGYFWASCTEYYHGPSMPKLLKKCVGQKISGVLADFLVAISLFRKRSKVDGFITSTNRGALLFACLQTMLPFGKKPHALIDCLWYNFPNKIKHKIFSYLLQFAGRSVTKYVVWESHEVEDYSKAFGVPKDKLHYIHFWHTLAGYQFEINDKRYVFAGGNWNRDYLMILDSAKKLPEVQFIIGTTRPEQLDGHDIPSNVTVKGYSHEGFRQAIADCSIMVVPMVDGLLHTGGQQTVLNAMYMGKPVIAVGRPWASDIILDKETGLIVDFGDTEQFEKSVQKIWTDIEYRHQIGQQAAMEAKAWPPSRSLEQIYRLTLNLNESEPIFHDSQTTCPK